MTKLEVVLFCHIINACIVGGNHFPHMMGVGSMLSLTLALLSFFSGDHYYTISY